MYFSISRQLTAARATANPTAGRQRRVRVLVGLCLATLFLALWVAWRLSWSAEAAQQLPAAVGDTLNLLTLAAVATVGVLWLLVLYQYGASETAVPATIPSVDALYALSPKQFEQFSAEVFRTRGYTVWVRGRSGDLGVDLEIVNGNGKRAIAQCKRYRTTVGPEIVRELYGTMLHERVAHAFLVTTAEISDGAREWAAGKPMTLIDGATLVELANSARLVLG